MLSPVLFIIYVNDLPDTVSNVCKLFADDWKIYKSVQGQQDQEDLQSDIDALCEWSEKWLLKFNIKKCKVVTFGQNRYEYDYKMINEQTKKT